MHYLYSLKRCGGRASLQKPWQRKELTIVNVKVAMAVVALENEIVI